MNKIKNAKLNKKLIGDEISLSRIKKPHRDGGRKPRQTQAPAWFKDFEKRINKRFDNLIKVNNLHE